MSRQRRLENEEFHVQFVGDEDVLEHVIEKQEGNGGKARKAETKSGVINVKTFLKKDPDNSEVERDDILKEQDYVDVLGTDIQDPQKVGPVVGGGDVYTFQAVKRSHKMAQLASELARTPGKSVTFSNSESPTEATTPPPSCRKHSTSNKTPSKGKKNEFVSTTPHRLRKRLTAPTLRSESESDYSASGSEGESTDERDEKTSDMVTNQKTPSKTASTIPPNKTPSKKSKHAAAAQLVEEYFEAHSSSKVLTSDRTLQRLQTPKLDQETLRNLLEKATPAFSEELKNLNQKHEALFYKWMLQLQTQQQIYYTFQDLFLVIEDPPAKILCLRGVLSTLLCRIPSSLGFNIILFGLGSKRNLLEKFRTSLLQDSPHIVINGFFPSITIKSILNSITEEVLDHMGTFRNPLDQLEFIIKAFRKGGPAPYTIGEVARFSDPDVSNTSLDLYLLIHNLDSQMLRGDKTQQVLGQLAAVPNIHLIASIDHINAPLMWDQSKQSLYNWLWYETTTYSPYLEETSYENSLLVKQSGALALSSLTHVLRSLTPNARGIFRLLAEYQLANKDNPSFPGLSFQDFYQQCREAFLVNSDLTLRAQLTEFRDHKLIRTKKGADGVEYLSIPVDPGTLTDFLEKEDSEM